MNDFKLQESKRSAIVNHIHGEEFKDLRNGFHKQAIGQMSYMTSMMMDKSLHRVFKSEENVVWIVAIDFLPSKTDLENFEKYALCIHELTGITWVRVAHTHKKESCNFMITPGKITSEKLGE